MDGGPNWAGWRADAAILVDPEKDEFLKQPIYYGIAHVSKFVPPGSIRIGLLEESLPESIQSVAFQRPDNGTVLVLLNKSVLSAIPTFDKVIIHKLASICITHWKGMDEECLDSCSQESQYAQALLS